MDRGSGYLCEAHAQHRKLEHYISTSNNLCRFLGAFEPKDANFIRTDGDTVFGFSGQLSQDFGSPRSTDMSIRLPLTPIPTHSLKEPVDHCSRNFAQACSTLEPPARFCGTGSVSQDLHDQQFACTQPDPDKAWSFLFEKKFARRISTAF